jgi:hypothetical protein
MGLYDVLLGIDRAARDTHRRIHVHVLARDRLSAAIEAEKIGDSQVREPGVEHTWTVSVRKLKPRPAGVVRLPLAA